MGKHNKTANPRGNQHPRRDPIQLSVDNLERFTQALARVPSSGIDVLRIIRLQPLPVREIKLTNTVIDTQTVRIEHKR